MARRPDPKPATKGVEDRAKAMEEQNAEYYARSEAAKPTPTQREADLAKVGALDIDDKEPDGSEPEEVAVRRALESRVPGNNPYETRDLSADAAPRRGRPRKAEGDAPSE